MDVEQLEGAEQNQLGRLLPLLVAGVDVGDAGGAFPGLVEIDLQHLAVRARLEVWPSYQRGQDRGLRAGLRVIAAAEPFAIAAKGARAEGDAERVRVCLRQVAGGLRKRGVTHLLCGLREECGAVGLLLRRRRVFSRAEAFERVAASLLLALDIARLARCAAQILELIVM